MITPHIGARVIRKKDGGERGTVLDIDRSWLHVRWDHSALLARAPRTWEHRTAITCVLPE